MSIDSRRFRERFPEIASHCNDEGLEALLAAMTERTVAAGEVVVREGEATDSLYLLVAGELATSLHDGDNVVEVGSVSPGDSVCKVNLLDCGPAVTTVTAKTDSNLLVLSHAAFRQLEDRHLKMTGNILRILSDELVERCRGIDRLLFSRGPGAGIDSEQHKGSGLAQWAAHVFKKTHS